MTRKTEGRLFTRGREKRYYLQYYVNGKEVRVALKTPSGQPIYKLGDAKDARERILREIRERDEAARWKSVADKIASAEQRAELAHAEVEQAKEDAHALSINMRATVSDGFNVLLECEHRPRTLRRFKVGDVIPRDTTASNDLAYYRHLATWLESQGVTLLSQMTHDMVVRFIEYLSQTLTSNTVNKHVNFLAKMYSVLIQDGRLVASNPFEGIERAQEDGGYSRLPLTVDELQCLFAKATGELKVLLILGYYTGLRRGDCATLLWREVDLSKRVIERIPSKTAERKKDKSLAVVKVGIPDDLQCVLDDLQRTGEYVLPKMARLYEPSHRPMLTRMIRAVFESIGLQTQQVIDGKRRCVYGFHSLRYSYISHHAEQGTPQPVIQRNAGHSSPAMTEHYERLSDKAALRYSQTLNMASVKVSELVHEIEKLLPSLGEQELNRVLDFVRDLLTSTPENESLSVQASIDDEHDDLRPVGSPNEIDGNPREI